MRTFVTLLFVLGWLTTGSAASTCDIPVAELQLMKVAELQSLFGTACRNAMQARLRQDIDVRMLRQAVDNEDAANWRQGEAADGAMFHACWSLTTRINLVLRAKKHAEMPACQPQ